MNCDEIQSRLSEYLDKRLDADTTASVEGHLSSCVRCRAEAGALARTIQLVATLPEIEPPFGFTTRVMAHVQDEAAEPGFWERFFLPFRIKLPIHAITVILISILAAYIYQKEPQQQRSIVALQPERSLPKRDEPDKIAPSATEPPVPIRKKAKVTAETPARFRAQEFQDSPKVEETPPLPRSEQAGFAAPKESPAIAPEGQLEERKEGSAGGQLGASATSSREQVRRPSLSPPGSVSSLQEKSTTGNETAAVRAASSPLGELQDKAPVPSPTQGQAGTASGVGGGAILPSPPQQKSSSSEVREIAPVPPSLQAPRSGTVASADPGADYELVVRLRSPSREDKAATDRLESLSAGVAARRSSVPQQEATSFDQARQRATQIGQPQVVSLTIPRNQYEPFKKELAGLGSIEHESFLGAREKDAAAKSSEQLRIRITIHPPVPPSLPSNR